LGIKSVLINCTYQDNDDEIVAYIREFDLIFVRETLSRDELTKLGVESKVVPDMSFFSEYKQNFKKPRNGTGVTDSVFINVSEELYCFAMKNNYSYLPALTDPFFLKGAFFNNLYKTARYYLFKLIKYFLWKLQIKLAHQNIRPFYYTKNYQDYIEKIAQLELLVVARYHSLCFALKTNTPFVALKSNSHKIEGLLRDVGVNSLRISSMQELINNKQKICPFSKIEQENINSYVRDASAKIENMFDEIAKLLQGEISCN